MQISRLITQLQQVQTLHGDIPVLVEVANTDVSPVEFAMEPVGEISVEERGPHGLSVGLIV